MAAKLGLLKQGTPEE